MLTRIAVKGYMKTQQVINGERKMFSTNMKRELYHKLRVAAAENDTTITAQLEHLIAEHLDHCRHDKIK